MSSIMPIQPFRPVRGGLESVARPLPAQVAKVEDWRTGVRVSGDYVGDDSAFIWPVGCEPSEAYGESGKPIDDYDFRDWYEFQPGFVAGAARCDADVRNSVIGDAARGRALRSLERNRWRQLASQFYSGNTGAGATQPGLYNFDGINSSGFQAPAGFDAANPNGIRETIAGLLDAQCDGCGLTADHAFFVPAAYQPYFDAALPSMRWDDAAGVWKWGDWRFVFDCFPNVLPPDNSYELTQATATDGTEAWIFLAPVPYVAFDDIIDIQVRTVEQNTRVVVAEQPSILAYDPGCTYGAKALVA